MDSHKRVSVLSYREILQDQQHIVSRAIFSIGSTATTAGTLLPTGLKQLKYLFINLCYMQRKVYEIYLGSASSNSI